MIIVIYILIVIIGFLIMEINFLKDQLKINEKIVDKYKRLVGTLEQYIIKKAK